MPWPVTWQVCTTNLCPDKEAVYREAFRILRHGGRLAISDMVWAEELAADLEASFQSTWAGCVGGASPAKRYFETVRPAGFELISVVGEHRQREEPAQPQKPIIHCNGLRLVSFLAAG